MSAGRVDDLTVMLVLMALAIAFIVLVRGRENLALAFYVGSIGLVPVWIGIQIGMFVGVATAVGGAVVVALGRGVRTTLTAWDGLVLFGIAVIVLSWLGGFLSINEAYGAVSGWLVPYVVARVLAARFEPRRIATVIAVVFLVVATLAVVEFVTKYNFFVHFAMPNATFAQWAGIRMRGGVPRAEGAFGSSIALGACLAMAVPFVWASSLRASVRALALVTIGLAAVFTFSRIGMLSTVLAVLLCLMCLGHEVSRRFRIGALVVLVVGVLCALPWAIEVFTEAGDEAAGSAQYRGDLLSLVPAINFIGRSSLAFKNASGTGGWGQFESIDNAYLMVGLTYGGLVLFLMLGLGVAAVVALIRGPRTPALVSLVCTLPGLTSVAFITQFTVFFWFVAGLAVAHGLAARAADPSYRGAAALRGAGPAPRPPGLARGGGAEKRPIPLGAAGATDVLIGAQREESGV